MKIIYIVNPAAGKGKESVKLIDEIKKASDEFEVYITKSEKDAYNYVKEYCKKGEKVRFIACGGDGTLNETVNGIMGFENAEAGVIPVGTGNDFCRNFGKEYDFKNISYQAYGGTQKCDIIKYKTEIYGEEKEGFAVNMLNIGFDCKVADMTVDVKKKSVISGPLAYFISIFLALVKKETTEVIIEGDGREIYRGKLLLTSLANGCYCGGGIKSNPMASLTDGLININIIKNLSRLRFISLLPYYMNGTFLDKKGIEKYAVSEKYKKITVTPLKGSMRMSVDGEIISVGKTEFEIVRKGFSFVLPCSSEKCQKEICIQINGKC